jgi:hypothetical protein
MSFTISVIVKGSGADHEVTSDPFTDRGGAVEDLDKIRRSRQLFLLDRLTQAESALPMWLVTDPGLIVAAWLNENDFNHKPDPTL